jgi:hypothetical protein
MFLFKKDKVAGLIKFYSLEDWWFSTFTKEEREYIDNTFIPMGGKPHSLTQGNIQISQSKVDFLAGLRSWFRAKKDISINQKIKSKLDEIAQNEPVNKPGYFKGRHYSSYVDEIVALKREEKYDDLEFLLFKLVEATEAESTSQGYDVVAPFYYEELAMLYRKQKEYAKEIAILERFFSFGNSSRVTKAAKLEKRLEKARELLAKGK